MSRRNMSERAMGGLMLCDINRVEGASTPVVSNSPGTDRADLLKALKEIFSSKNSEISKTDEAAREKEKSLTDLDTKLFAYKNGVGSTGDGQSKNASLEDLTETLGKMLKQNGIADRKEAEEVVGKIAEKYTLTADQKKEIMDSLDAQKERAGQEPDLFIRESKVPLTPEQQSPVGEWKRNSRIIDNESN
jgi:hypothetical protein